MSVVKERVIELIKALPDDCTLEDILYRLYVREKIEAGLGAVEEGRTIPQDEVEKRSGRAFATSACSPQRARRPVIGAHDGTA